MSADSSELRTPAISIVVPVYKEEQNIRPFLQRLIPVCQKLADCYEIIFAVDPSPDKTEEIIQEEINKNPSIRMLVFSRRFGQPAATIAGILSCNGASCGVIDVDLQDPPELFAAMYEKLQGGSDVVYAKRRSRQGETLIKRIISYAGYAIINQFSDIEIPRDTGDFRIISRRVIEELRKLNESHCFLRGLVAYVGFKQDCIEYDRDARLSGTGNYNRLTGSLKIGLNGIISYSTKPLFMMSVIGFSMSLFSLLLGAFYVVQKLLVPTVTPGLSTTILTITFFSGIQLFCMGLMGEYIGRIYDEVKRRPKYIIERDVQAQKEPK